MPDYIQTTYSTDMGRGIEGALADASPVNVIARVNAEASASIAFGRAVRQGTGDTQALLPAAQANEIIGITVHSNAYSKGDVNANLDAIGVKAGGLLSVLRKGRVLVMARSAVTNKSRLYVRAVSSGTGFETLGGLEAAADSTDMIDCTAQGSWMGTAAQGALCVLEVDFTNK